MVKPLKTLVDNKNWYKDRYQHVLVQRKILVFITLLALACTLITVITISQLTPLKTVEPFVIQVDQRSGVTQTVDPMNVRDLTSNEIVNNAQIVNYIRARENYNIYDLKRSYDVVRVMSAGGKVYQDFQNAANPNNPDSNTARLGNGGERFIKIQSITYLNPQLVQVRVVAEDKIGGSVRSKNLIILLAFEYVKMNLTAEERYINPLGFRVTEYRVDEDVLQK